MAVADSNATMVAPMVEIRDLRVTFTGGKKPVQAVNGVSLAVQRGEVVALIGESGSGKSVTLRTLLRLHNERRSQITGQVQVAGQDVLAMDRRTLADYRGKITSMIFQEPLLALDPVYTLGRQIVESIRRHEPVSAAEAHQRALALFERVRIPSPERRLAAYPHEMSGGMRQRAMIALALACRPQVLLAAAGMAAAAVAAVGKPAAAAACSCASSTCPTPCPPPAAPASTPHRLAPRQGSGVATVTPAVPARALLLK